MMRGRFPVALGAALGVNATWLAPASAFQEVAPATQPMVTTLPVRSWDRLRTAAPGLGVEIPTAISDRDLTRYAQILELSEEQILFLRSHHRDYLDRIDALERDHAQDFALAAKAFNPSEYGPAYYTGFMNWRSTEDAFSELVAREDDQLLVVLTMVLSEQQLERLPRVRMHRDRARCSPPRWRGLFSARIDLSRLIEQMPWPPESNPAMEALMWEYEQALTPMVLEAHRAHRTDGLRREALRHQTRFDANGAPLDMRSPAVAEQQRACLDAIAATYYAHAQVQTKIADLNEAFMPRFVMHMPPDHALLFEQTFLQKSYQRVYPDPDDPEALFRKVVADGRVQPETQALLIAQWDLYRAEYLATCKAMEKESREWQRQMIGSVSPSNIPEHEARMAELLDRRVDAGERFLVTMLSLLPPDMLVEGQELVEQWRASVSRNANQRARAGGGVDMR